MPPLPASVRPDVYSHLNNADLAAALSNVVEQKLEFFWRVPTEERAYDDIVVAVRPLDSTRNGRNTCLPGPTAFQWDLAEIACRQSKYR